MLLNELYQEENDSTFTHNGKEYHLNTLLSLTKDAPCILFPVPALSWVLQYTKITPSRVDTADVSVPILVVKDDNEYVVVDGAHRLARAVRDDVQQIQGKLVTSSKLNQALILPT